MILPNYIGIGAPKAGTTWLARCLGEHPEVFMAAVKETEFWKFANAEDRLAEYAEHFSRAGAAKAIGEYSVRYLSFPGVPERIHRVLPQVKLIVSLRNPIEQVYSNYWHLHRQNFTQRDASRTPRSIEEALQTHREMLLDPARYAQHLARWQMHFPREQLHVILFDEIQRQPAEVLARVFAFLEVDPGFQPPSTTEKGSAVRQGTSPRNERASRVHRRIYDSLVGGVYTPLKRWVGTRRAAKIKDMLRVRWLMERLFMRRGYPPMSEATRALLAAEFAPEIDELRRLTGLHFDSWK